MNQKPMLSGEGAEKHDSYTGDASIYLGLLMNGGMKMNNGYKSLNGQENGGAGRQVDKVDKIMKESAISTPGDTSLNDIIKSMVKAVYGSARLSLPEFVERFKRDKIAELIADNFENDLQVLDDSVMEDLSPDDVSKENGKLIEQEVLDQAFGFLDEKGLTSAETMYSCLAQKKDEWRAVSLSKLFVMPISRKNPEGQTEVISLKNCLIRVIYNNLSAIASDAYREKFNEDKTGFVMGFMMARVIKPDLQERKMSFDQVEFTNLMNYLDSIGYSIAKLEGKSLYDLLCDKSRGMASYVEEQKVKCMRFGVRNRVVQALEILPDQKKSEKLIFEDGFDVKGFYDKHIRMAIFRYYSKKLSKVTVVREVDLFHKILDPENMGRTNYTVQMLRYIKDLVKLSKDAPDVFMIKLRELLGLEKSPLHEDLPDEEVTAHFRLYLRESEAKFRRNMVDALFFRQDPEIHAACSYPEPILSCDNVPDLLEWFSSPKAFKSKYPEYQSLPDDQVVFMCASFLRGFMYTMQEMSTKEFMQAEFERDLLEKKDNTELEIVEIEKLDLKFKVLEEVNNDGSPVDKPALELALDTHNLGQFIQGAEVDEQVDPELSRKVMGNHKLLELEWKGRNYRVLPRETKHFTLVEMLVPEDCLDGEGKPTVKKVRMRVLIYTGDSHYIHVKDLLTRIMSQERGKQVSDPYRQMLVFANPSNLRTFKNFLYKKNTMGLIKVEDPEEKRFVSNKIGKAVRTKSTEGFKKGLKFNMSAYVHIPARAVDGKIQIIKLILERQCYELKPLLMYNLSEYTDTSHDDYRAQRAWPQFFKQYFPPEIFGDKFKKFQNEGYRKNSD
jgi:hypothetical protein